VFYQPVVSLDHHRPVGLEALVRWRHPERGLVSPAEFIPVAEDSSLIVPIDLFVMKTAVRQLQAWRQAFGVPLSMSVNASRRHFARAEYLAEVREALELAGVPPQALHLEVTETLAMALSAQGQGLLRALDELGVKLYVDDFGTGYSSLSLLHTYPFTGLKLDRSFTSRVDQDSTTGEVVKAILAMAHALSLEVVAEGVETPDQAATLKALGCTSAQGYLFCTPMPAAQVTEWLRERLTR
jgi:EAL domain-containing protein (putative c-di-GMP-specific phosphodiesterase class I)